MEFQDLLARAQEAQRTDRSLAAALASALREQFPDRAAGYRIGIDVARAAKDLPAAATLAGDAMRLFPDETWPFEAAAWIARSQGSLDEARRLAATLRAQRPEVPSGYHVGCTVARDLKLHDEAWQIASDALERFAPQPWLLESAALGARGLGRSEDTRRYAAMLREQFPAHPAGYQIGALAAREVQDFDEAATIASAAIERFPETAWPLEQAAWTARARRHPNTAAIADQLRARFPDSPAGHQIGLHLAREASLLEDARARAADCIRRFPAQLWPLEAIAWIDRATGDLDAADRRANELRERFPDSPVGYQIAALNAKDRGDVSEALALAAVLRERCPNHSAGFQIGVACLYQSGRVSDAIALAEDAKRRFPFEQWIDEQLARLRAVADNRERASHLIIRLRGATLGLPIPDPRVVVVLGMHRAGTSLCTKLISALGVDLGGPLMAAGVDNPDGFQEHAEIVALHQSLLRAAGLDWDTIWSVETLPDDLWTSAHTRSVEDKLVQLVRSQLDASGGVWGFKDPRTARLLPLWKSVFARLRVQPAWLVAVRHPTAVARSLARRDGMPPDIAELLWLEHYVAILSELGGGLAGVFHYEAWFDSPASQLQRLAEAIGVEDPVARARAAALIRPELRHNRSNDGEPVLTLAREFHAMLAADPLDLGMAGGRAASLARALARGGAEFS